MAAGPSGTPARRADLHAHTTASDGLLSPASLVELASERGISMLAVTDHDTTGGLAAARAAAAALGVTCIDGIEFSTRAWRGQTHILGYGIAPGHPALMEELEVLRASRRQRGAIILERLRDLGIEVDVAGASGDEQSPGRPHIARALVEGGFASSVSDAFERYLGTGRPAFAPRRTLTAERAIELIRDSGGIAVLAHPLSVHDLNERLPEFIEHGLLGLEAYYGEYDEEQRAELAKLAGRLGLLVTGGSDFHGDGSVEGRDFGSVNWPEAELERFLSYLR